MSLLRIPAYVLPLRARAALQLAPDLQPVLRQHRCFIWMFHDVGADGHPLPQTCARDGKRTSLCPLRKPCAEGWESSRAAADTATLPASGTWAPRLRGARERRQYVATGLRRDEVLRGFLVGLGLPPVVGRQFHLAKKTDIAWAHEHMGPLFAVSPSSYHALYCFDPVSDRYRLVMRAATSHPTDVAVDIADDIAGGLTGPWAKEPTPAHWQESWKGGKTRVVLTSAGAAKDFAGAALAASPAAGKFGEIAAWGLRWRGAAKAA